MLKDQQIVPLFQFVCLAFFVIKQGHWRCTERIVVEEWSVAGEHQAERV